MDKKLQSIINRILTLPRIRLNNATPESIEISKQILGKNLPKQLSDWLSLYDGAVFNVGDELFPTVQNEKVECMYTLAEANSKQFKIDNGDVDDCAMCFGKPNFAGYYCFDGDEVSENIYLWDCEESAAVVCWKDFADFLKEVINNMYLVEDAFEIYFEKLQKLTESSNNGLPKVQYSDDICKNLIKSEIDDSGYVEWMPQRREEIDISYLEDDLEFSLNGNLVDYYTKYIFCLLNGKVGRKKLSFYPVNCSSDALADFIMNQFNSAQSYFPYSQMFLIGKATVGTDDGYYIFYNNEIDKLFIYNPITKKKSNLDSLSLTIATMEPIF